MKNYGFIKCAISTLNGELGNPIFNAEKIKKIVSVAITKNVQLIVFPELSLTGYSCQDLFSFSTLTDSALEALNALLAFSCNSEILILVGMPIKVEESLYNCAVAIQNGKILGIVPKQYLPNSNEFCEKRWFTPYTSDSLEFIDILGETVPFGKLIFSSSIGFKLGIEIGEDLFAIIPPSSYLTLAGANIIANLSASNELVGKNEFRKEIIKNQSSRTHSAYLYTSAGFGESTSELVFGGSGYAFENGKNIISLNRYQIYDQLACFDVDIEYLANERKTSSLFTDCKSSQILNFREIKFTQNINNDDEYTLDSREINPHPFVPDDANKDEVCEEVISILSTALAKRLSAIRCSKVTIGISGGLDSTLALLVCNESFKKLGLNTSGIIAITMPGFGTSSRTHENAFSLCKELGVSLREISIKDSCVQHLKDIGHDINNHDVTYENVQARERTNILMNVANQNNAIVIGTGDLSELVLGWCTYNGDHMSMYGVNSSIPKTLVKYLIEWYAYKYANSTLKEILLDIVDTPISPELLPPNGEEIKQQTENEIGPYEVIDFFIYHFLRNKFSKDKILYLAKIAFSDKYDCNDLEKYYDSFIKRFFIHQFKRNCLPDGPKVGTVGISSKVDFKMPSDISGTIFK